MKINLTAQERNHFNAYMAQQATINGATDPATQFNVEPTVQQRFIEAQGHSSEFLSRINIVPVAELKGEALYLDDDQLIAGRTDTSGNGVRKPRVIGNKDKITYELFQTDYDTALPYKQIRQWVKFPDYQKRISNYIAKLQARSRLKIGFNGITAADTTNPVTNPLGQDANIGWLQKVRLHKNKLRVLDGGATAGEIVIGTGGDYLNLDALVYDLVETKIEEWERDREDLVVICGRKLLSDKYFPLINKETDEQNQLARDLIISQKRLGNLQAVRAPYFPANALMVTSLSNLSIYEQEGQRHKHFKDAPEKNQYENYEDVPEAYVIENYSAVALAENIEFAP